MQFRSTVLLGGKTATGIAVPPAIVAALGAGQRPAVRVTINGYTYRSTVAPRGGLFMLPLSAEHRAGAGIAAGDDVVVDLELDTAPREVSVPADFQAALDGDEDAARRFTALAYSHRLRHVLAIEGAKSVETRQRRIAKAVETLRVEAGGAS